MKKIFTIALSIFLSCLLIACQPSGNSLDNYVDKEVNEQENKSSNLHYGISTSEKLATELGEWVLENGGTAADVLVASSFMLNVIESFGSGIGGSGGALVYDPDTEDYIFYDYMAQAGSQDNQIGIPGQLDGLWQIHQDHGKLPWEDLIEPAITVAEEGFTIGPKLSYKIATLGGQVEQFENFIDGEGQPLATGDRLIQSDLAESFREIQANGITPFYEGELGRQVAEAAGLNFEEFEDYQTREMDPIILELGDHRLIGAPAPFGSQMTLQMYRDMIDQGIRPLEERPNQFLDIYQRAYVDARNDGSQTIADPSFYDFDQEDYLAQSKVVSREERPPIVQFEEEPGSTTHLSIVDQEGMVISATQTLSNFWGSRVQVGGFFLNNSNRNFSDTGINSYEPHKRARTTSSPIIVDKDSEKYAIGSPGGGYIPQVLAYILLQHEQFNKDFDNLLTQQRFLVNRDGSIILDQSEVNQEDEVITELINGSGRNIIRERKATFYGFGSISIAGYDGEDYFAYGDVYREGYSLSN